MPNRRGLRERARLPFRLCLRPFRPGCLFRPQPSACTRWPTLAQAAAVLPGQVRLPCPSSRPPPRLDPVLATTQSARRSGWSLPSPLLFRRLRGATSRGSFHHRFSNTGRRALRPAHEQGRVAVGARRCSGQKGSAAQSREGKEEAEPRVKMHTERRKAGGQERGAQEQPGPQRKL